MAELALPFTPQDKHDYYVQNYSHGHKLYPDLFLQTSGVNAEDRDLPYAAETYIHLLKGVHNALLPVIANGGDEHAILEAFEKIKGNARIGLGLLNESELSALREQQETLQAEFDTLMQERRMEFETYLKTNFDLNTDDEIKAFVDKYGIDGETFEDILDAVVSDYRKNTSPQSERLIELNKELQGIEGTFARQTDTDTLERLRIARDVYLPAIVDRLMGDADKITRDFHLLENFIADARVTYPDIDINGSIPISTDEEKNIFSTLFSEEDRTGVGIVQGQYGVADSVHGPKVLATDFLMDCVSVILHAEHPETGHKIGILTHLDISANIPREMDKLLAHIPEGYSINAHMLGSDRNDSSYMNTEVAHSLLTSGRISSFNYNVHGPSTVALHIETGQVLTSDIRDGDGTNYSIGEELPISVDFTQDIETYQSYQQLVYDTVFNAYNSERLFTSTTALRMAVHPTLPGEALASPKNTFDRLVEDGVLDAREVEALKAEITEMTGENVDIGVNQWGVIKAVSDNIDLGLAGTDSGIQAPSLLPLKP